MARRYARAIRVHRGSTDSVYWSGFTVFSPGVLAVTRSSTVLFSVVSPYTGLLPTLDVVASSPIARS
jgi:hypothetical protein